MGLGTFLRQRRRRFTAGGLLFAAAALGVAGAAFVSGHNLLFLLLAAMLATGLISGFISRLTLAGLELDLQAPEHISARRSLAARILVRNAKGWMPSFSIHLAGTSKSGFTSALYFPVIPGGATLEELVEVSFARRGRYTDASFQFSTRFPFGFAERHAQVKLRHDVLVYPSLEGQPGFEETYDAIAGDIAAHYRGRGHDFYRIRPYEALESARHVDWKATAHTGELQVREFAREQDPLLELVLDLAVPAEAAGWFEQAVECCAYLAWRVAERGGRLRMRTQEFDARMPEECDVYAILKYLALVTPSRARALPVADDEHSFQVVFSLSPDEVAEAGWSAARVVGREALPPRA